LNIVNKIQVDGLSINQINKKIKNITEGYIYFYSNSYDADRNFFSIQNETDIVEQLLKIANLSSKHSVVFASPGDKDFMNYELDFYPHNFPILINKDLFINFGPLVDCFDDFIISFVEFAVRINEFGYSTIRANLLTSSQNSEFPLNIPKIDFTSNDHKKLLQTFPYFDNSQRRFEYSFIDPIRKFSNTEPNSILINCIEALPMEICGITKITKSLLFDFINLNQTQNSKFNLTVLVSDLEVIKFHQLEKLPIDFITPDLIGDRIFKLCFIPCQNSKYKTISISNNSSLKIVTQNLDAIFARSQYLWPEFSDYLALYEEMMKFSDSVIHISNFTKHDTNQLFNEDYKNSKEILLGFPRSDKIDYEECENGSIQKLWTDNTKYVYLSGNHHKHKVIQQTIDAMKRYNLSVPVVVLGNENINKDNIIMIKSGGIPQHIIDELISRSSLVLYPSLYEGFGYPFSEAAYFKKPIIANRNEISYEISKLYTQLDIYYYTHFDEIPVLMGQIFYKKDKSNVPFQDSTKIRMQSDANTEIWEHLQLIMSQPTDVQKLRDRWDYFTKVDQHLLNSQNQLTQSRNELIQTNQKLDAAIHPNGIKQALKNEKLALKNLIKSVVNKFI
jgi:hypothetical protein